MLLNDFRCNFFLRCENGGRLLNDFRNRFFRRCGSGSWLLNDFRCNFFRRCGSRWFSNFRDRFFRCCGSGSRLLNDLRGCFFRRYGSGRFSNFRDRFFRCCGSGLLNDFRCWFFRRCGGGNGLCKILRNCFPYRVCFRWNNVLLNLRVRHIRIKVRRNGIRLLRIGRFPVLLFLRRVRIFIGVFRRVRNVSCGIAVNLRGFFRGFRIVSRRRLAFFMQRRSYQSGAEQE